LIDSVIPLEGIDGRCSRIEQRNVFGKIIVTPVSDPETERTRRPRASRRHRSRAVKATQAAPELSKSSIDRIETQRA
jgi:hypothetical protein